MGIYTGHNPSSQDEIDNMIDAELVDRLLEQIKELKSRVADLETVIDEIPNMGALFGAVQELQEQYEAPANTFTHYVGGSRE